MLVKIGRIYSAGSLPDWFRYRLIGLIVEATEGRRGTQLFYRIKTADLTQAIFDQDRALYNDVSARMPEFMSREGDDGSDICLPSDMAEEYLMKTAPIVPEPATAKPAASGTPASAKPAAVPPKRRKGAAAANAANP